MPNTFTDIVFGFEKMSTEIPYASGHISRPTVLNEASRPKFSGGPAARPLNAKRAGQARAEFSLLEPVLLVCQTCAGINLGGGFREVALRGLPEGAVHGPDLPGRALMNLHITTEKSKVEMSHG